MKLLWLSDVPLTDDELHGLEDSPLGPEIEVITIDTDFSIMASVAVDEIMELCSMYDCYNVASRFQPHVGMLLVLDKDDLELDNILVPVQGVAEPVEGEVYLMNEGEVYVMKLEHSHWELF